MSKLTHVQALTFISHCFIGNDAQITHFKQEQKGWKFGIEIGRNALITQCLNLYWYLIIIESLLTFF
jgi:hypothetical protein